jgi:hypothetical protein
MISDKFTTHVMDASQVEREEPFPYMAVSSCRKEIESLVRQYAVWRRRVTQPPTMFFPQAKEHMLKILHKSIEEFSSNKRTNTKS